MKNLVNSILIFLSGKAVMFFWFPRSDEFLAVEFYIYPRQNEESLSESAQRSMLFAFETDSLKDAGYEFEISDTEPTAFGLPSGNRTGCDKVFIEVKLNKEVVGKVIVTFFASYEDGHSIAVEKQAVMN